MVENNESNNYLLKKYWKTWALFSVLILSLFFLNEFIFQYEVITYLVFTLIVLLPIIFYMFVTKTEKKEGNNCSDSRNE